jgi:multicomponent Na+:H+ antiporter subunit B
MNSLILRTASRYLLVVLVVFSVFVLLRGHNEPGGGFIGGLLTAGGLTLYGLAFGPTAVRKLIRLDPRTLIGVGLICALVAAIAGPLTGRPVLTGLWAADPVPGIGKISTVLLFDVGVHLAVVGAIALILISLAEED